MHVVRCREEISYTSPVNYWEKPTPRKKVEREVGGRGIRERKVQKRAEKCAFQPERFNRLNPHPKTLHDYRSKPTIIQLVNYSVNYIRT